MSQDNLRAVRGTRDILPSEQAYWRYIKNILYSTAQSYGFAEIATPIFEYGAIFSKAIGEETDIVAKEMYYLQSADEDRPIALRPEGTAGVVRAYYEHGLFTEPIPLRLFYFGPMFRHERPQRGRLRQFYQFGVESIGDGNASEDALCILLGRQILDRLGLANSTYHIEINSVGCSMCRPKYISKLVQYLNALDPKKLCDDCLKRKARNPLRVFDCKVELCQKQLAQAPTPLDFLCNDCKAHFKALLEYLEATRVNFSINSRLVRGLDYYTRTVFEIISDTGAAQGLALIAGGRYDKLIALFGKKDAPAIGFGLGAERIVQSLHDAKITPPREAKPQVFVVQLGESAKKKSFTLLEQLIASGITTSSALSKDSLKSQLKAADRAGAKLAIIIGQREIIDKSVIIKDLRSGGQETVDFEQCVTTINDRLQGMG